MKPTSTAARGVNEPKRMRSLRFMTHWHTHTHTHTRSTKGNAICKNSLGLFLDVRVGVSFFSPFFTVSFVAVGVPFVALFFAGAG